MTTDQVEGPSDTTLDGPTEAFQFIAILTEDAASATEQLSRGYMRIEDTRWEEAAALLSQVRNLRKTMQTLEATAERWIAAVWKDQKIRDAQDVDNVGRVTVRKGSNRKSWDHDDLAAVVLERKLAEAGGEYTPHMVRDWLMEVMAPSYWRTGVLKSLGIDPDDYCETIPGKATVQIDAPDRPTPVRGDTDERALTLVTPTPTEGTRP